MVTEETTKEAGRGHAAREDAGYKPAPQQKSDHGLYRSAEHLLMWIVACLAGLPDNAMAGLGLGKVELEACKLRWGADFEGLQVMRLVSRHLTRERMAELLRVRIGGLALTAGTPSEMAAVARAVRSLPDWVWDDAAVDGDGKGRGHAAREDAGYKPAPHAAARPTGNQQNGLLADWQADMPGAALVDSMFGPPLSRQERRRLDALQKKGK